MADPFDVLGLTNQASEAEIRQRYLELVRAFPPERAPERFATVHAAYQSLKHPAGRLESQLFGFDCDGDSLESLSALLRQKMCGIRLPVETLLSLADSS